LKREERFRFGFRAGPKGRINNKKNKMLRKAYSSYYSLCKNRKTTSNAYISTFILCKTCELESGKKVGF